MDDNEQLDEALNAPPTPAPATFDDHMNAVNDAISGIVTAGSGSIEDRWNPADFGSIARRDFYDLGINNPDAFQSKNLKDEARQLNNVFGGVPESTLIALDTTPLSVRAVSQRRDMRLQNLPQAESAVTGTQTRSMVKPIGVTLPPTPGQYGPGSVTNAPKASPATMPTSYSGVMPVIQPPKRRG